uniref:Polyprotein protein n=1 Tax=Solanum tuberosum TaxID=4113 RepID=M1DWP4_SOLTU
MGSLSRSADVRAARVEKNFPMLIDQAILNALDSLSEQVVKCKKTVDRQKMRIDELTTRIDVLEKTAGSSSVLDILRAKVGVDENVEDEELAEETDEEGLREDEHGIVETLIEVHETEEVVI